MAQQATRRWTRINAMSKSESPKDASSKEISASENIDRLIARLADWRGNTLASIRKAILAADREIVEEWKWMGSPVWSRAGNIVVGNAHKDKVKLTFAHGASLPDPEKLFNNGFGGKVWRAIDVFEGDKVNTRALTKLVCAAIDYNQLKLEKKVAARKKAPLRKAAAATATKVKAAKRRPG
jgi:hypothetical protein